MTEFWVDPRSGLDTNLGLNPLTDAKKTIQGAIQAAFTAGPSAHRINLLAGTYTNEAITSFATKITIRGCGMVVIQSTLSGASLFMPDESVLSSFGAVTHEWRFENLIFKNYKSIIKLTLDGSTLNVAGADFKFYSENCAYAISPAFTNPSPSCVVNLIHTGVVSANVPVNPFVKLYLQNNTVYKTDHVYICDDQSTPNPIPADSLVIASLWERNNNFDVINRHTGTGRLELITGASGSDITRDATGCDYNLVPQENQAPAGTALTGGLNDISYGSSSYPTYNNNTVEPIDLSIYRPSNSPVYGPATGGVSYQEYSNLLGATWWPVIGYNPLTGIATEMFGQSKENPINSGAGLFPENWSEQTWKNDEQWYDTQGLTTGAEAAARFAGSISNSNQIVNLTETSPATLTTDSDPRWIIDDSNGGAISAKVLSPVYDAGHRVHYKGIDFWGEYDLSTSSDKQVLDANNSGSTRELEVRASNSVFSQTATYGQLSWETMGRFVTDTPSPYARADGPFRYWQFRVTLRTDAS